MAIRISSVLTVLAIALSTTLLAAAQCDTPSTVSDFSNSALPNPFLFNNGTAVTTIADWACRRAQLAALIQGYEAGSIPDKPTSITGSMTGNSLVVNVNNNGETASFSNPITFPNGAAPASGWPLVIAYGGPSLPIPTGIAVMNYNNNNIALQNDASSRGIGLFYNLYGSNATASAMSAWVWGVSRIIDALETTPSANIDVSRIAVTGCSRNGKGALMAGAFEERIALTLPQESGSGGDTSWRLSKFEQDSGSVVQTATEIVQENVWFSTNFDNFVNDLSVLPYDHHSLIALVAPRPIISFENTDFVWLSPMSAWGTVSAARTVFQALGVQTNHGFAQVGGHDHCAWPSSLTPALDAFFNKFLLNQNVDSTDFFSTNSVFGNATWDPSQWINWQTPTLS